MAVRALLGCTILGTAVLGLGAAAPVKAGETASPQVAFQGFPRLPRVPRIPQIGTRGSSSDTAAEPVRPNASNRELEREYDQDMGMLAYGIPGNWSSKEDNARIEAAVAEYRERVERVASGRYASVSATKQDMANDRLRAEYDTHANTAEREIAWAMQQIGQIGVADAAYNNMLVLDTLLHGAVTLYPDVPEYREAKAKSAEALARFGSREGANQQKEAAAIAEARKVQMPPSIDRSAASVQQFRQAWATGGIPGTIRRIHVTSGWGVKRNSLGVVIGRTRNAAIAVQDPETGNCRLYDFTMIIEPGGSPRRSSHSSKRMACENIP